MLSVRLLCRSAAFTAIAALSLSGTSGSSLSTMGRRVIEPFDYRGVTLDAGSLRNQFDEVRDYYIRIPNDDLLKGFRSRAGLPAPGADLGNWYSSDIFHNFGQILSGLSRMYAASNDQAVREKVDSLISGWGRCIEPDGYFYYSRKPNAPNYTYEKMVCGLVDAYVYCHNEYALKCLSRITDWAEKNLNRDNVYAFGADSGALEWYTLSENLYRAYLVTGDSRYRDFARVWEYTDYWNTYAAKGDIFKTAGAYHAYSHVNTLSGAGAAYLVTGEMHYLDTLVNAYDYLQANQVYATGGYGPNEQLLPPDRLHETLYSTVNSFETQCGSWGAFKMSKYLLSFTGDARYGDWVERLVVNGIGASIPMSSNGEVMYYANYNIGGASKRNIAAWSCCAGTRPQAVADYHDLIYFKDSEGVYVNLFTPSTLEWKHNGLPVTIRQRTRFPESTRVDILVSTARPAAFGINVRVPGWLARPMTATINGKPVEIKSDALHWAQIQRVWKDGDRLSVELPMKFWSARFPDSSPKQFPSAVLRGPVVMAFRTSGRNPGSLIDFDRLAGSFIPSRGEALTYHLASDPTVLVRPYYAFKASEPYFMYLDPEVADINALHSQLQYGADWIDVGTMHITRTPGSVVEHAFEGTGIRWICGKFDDAGKAEVSIDGRVVDTVDLYDPVRGVPFKWERTDLSSGKHTFRIKLIEERNPASKDCYINIERLEILDTSKH